MKFTVLSLLTLICLLSRAAGAAEFRELDWLELLPDQDRRALMSQGPISHDGSPEGARRPILGGDNEAYDQSTYFWYSSDFVGELNGQQVRLPGFVVPLEYDDQQRVTEFFLVPYFGACIHLPPPPPNQIIYVKADEPLSLTSIYDPYVVEGEMRTETTSNAVGLSAYSIGAVNIRPYQD